MAQLVERILGKDEVPGSNPGSSSKKVRKRMLSDFFIQADEGGLVCNQRARAWYVIATESRMASRTSVYVSSA